MTVRRTPDDPSDEVPPSATSEGPRFYDARAGVLPPPSADPYTVAPESRGSGGCSVRVEGHNEWVESATHHIGFTTAWPPNKQIRGGPNGEYADTDLTSKREKTGGPTFAAVAARSYHPGGVNTLLGDGSVRCGS